MAASPSPTHQHGFNQPQEPTLSPESSVSIDLPDSAAGPSRPSPLTHLSTPSYESPLRHHRRQPSTPRQVKETLNARSEYTNSEDDGTAIHRINQYVIQQEIGRGSFGAVHKAVDQFNNEYAVKEFSKARLRKRAQSSILRRAGGFIPRRSGNLGGLSELNAPLHHEALHHRRSASDVQEAEEGNNPLYLIREEIAIMKKLNHNNLAGLYEVLDDPSEDSLYMVMEMCKKGVVMKLEVGDRADPYDVESCRCWFRDLILGVEYLHAQGVVHRDIKPDNLLLTDDNVLKIVDFGVSEMFERSSEMTTTKSAGSPAFLPPELCVSRHGPISGKAADIWSMGVTLFCLFYGKVPFEKVSVLDLYASIKNDVVDFPYEPPDANLRDLLVRILEKDPEKRIKMEELRVHPWVTKGGIDPLLSAEENTSDIVEPPTAEEVNRAITGNLSNLIVVMKAVRKFRRLLQRRRPYLMNSMLEQGTRLVQPPMSLSPQTSPPLLNRDTSFDGAADRRPVEGGLISEAVHRSSTLREEGEMTNSPESSPVSQRSQWRGPSLRTNVVQPTPLSSAFPMSAEAKQAGAPSDSDRWQAVRSPEAVQSPTSLQSPVTFQSPDGMQSPPGGFQSPTPFSPLSQQSPTPSGHDVRSPKSPDYLGKGQAHDPLVDFHWLRIGTGYGGDGDGPAGDLSGDEEALEVCESPPATDDHIYETAYEEEVARIRARTMGATLYMTRRVEEPEKHGKAPSGDRRRTAPDVAREALGRLKGVGLHAKGKAAGEVGAAAESLRRKMEEVKAESDKRLKKENTKQD